MGVHLSIPPRPLGAGWCACFADLPPYSGVYRLEHAPSGYVYVGASAHVERRRRSWRFALGRVSDPAYADRPAVFFNMTRRFHDVARELPRDGWSFVLVERFDQGTPYSVVADAEEAEISRLFALSPGRLLNVSRHAGASMRRPRVGIDAWLYSPRAQRSEALGAVEVS